MNQTKWLSDFIYDVESTPLLWSFDDPEQDVLTSPGRARSQSFPILRELTESTFRNGEKVAKSIYDDTTIWQKQVKSSRSLSIPQAFIDEVSKLDDENPVGITIHDGYLEISNGYSAEISDLHNDDAKCKTGGTDDGNLEIYSQETACSNEKTEDGDEHLSSMIFMNTSAVPTYLEVESRENEKRRLLSKVPRFPTYLAISSPEEDERGEISHDVDNNLPSPIQIDIKSEVPQRGEATTVDYKEYLFQRSTSQSSSDNETPDDVEYLSGGIWYSDEEEELAIKKLCAYENPAFEPDATSSESEDDENPKTEINTAFPNESGGGYANKRNAEHSKTSERKYSCSESDAEADQINSTNSSRKEIGVFKGNQRKSKNEQSHCYDSDDDSQPRSGQLADIVSLDDVASLIEKCHSEGFIIDEDRTSSSSECEMASSPSTHSQLLSSECSHDNNSPTSDTETDCDLVWDAYIPPLTIRWSDMMIKQIFDTVEKDNEEYVTRIRELTQKRDIRPLNILQRLYWYDEESGSLQSLVGVFEFNL